MPISVYVVDNITRNYSNERSFALDMAFQQEVHVGETWNMVFLANYDYAMTRIPPQSQFFLNGKEVLIESVEKINDHMINVRFNVITNFLFLGWVVIGVASALGLGAATYMAGEGVEKAAGAVEKTGEGIKQTTISLITLAVAGVIIWVLLRGGLK
jgi:hypothetical protein